RSSRCSTATRACEGALIHNLDLRPTNVRIECVHCRGDRSGLRTQVLLEDDAVLIHHEGHDSRSAVRNRPGNQGKALRHAATFDVIARPVRRVRPLGRQDAEEITVIGTWAGSAPIDRIAFLSRLSDQRLQGAVRITFAGYPIQAVVFSRRAEKVLCIFRLAVLAAEGKKSLLRVDKGQSGADRRDLITADATVNQFLRTGPRIKLPASIRLHQWYGQRPMVPSHLQDLAVRRRADKLV